MALQAMLAEQEAKAEQQAYNDAVNQNCTSQNGGTTYYRDSDGDGYGGTQTTTACTNPGAGWVTQGGDCDDGADGADVHPGQTGFFAKTYTAGGAVPSYDFNCDGTQAPQNAQAIAADCALSQDGSSCTGEGVIPATTGGSICGSTKYRKCTYVAPASADGTGTCKADDSDLGTPVACN
jgi:hypothetical protein